MKAEDHDYYRDGSCFDCPYCNPQEEETGSMKPEEALEELQRINGPIRMAGNYAEAYGRLCGAIEVALINLEHGHTSQQVIMYLKGALQRAEVIAKGMSLPSGT